MPDIRGGVLPRGYDTRAGNRGNARGLSPCRPAVSGGINAPGNGKRGEVG
nr:MAG TPA: hypothetical protein [Caudoviricetes sp.]